MLAGFLKVGLRHGAVAVSIRIILRIDVLAVTQVLVVRLKWIDLAGALWRLLKSRCLAADDVIDLVELAYLAPLHPSEVAPAKSVRLRARDVLCV